MDPQMALVMEYMEIGDLNNYIGSHPYMKWDTRYKIMLDVAKGKLYN